MTLRIDVDRLPLSYDDTTALDDVTFSLPGGRIYGLLGRTGSGRPACSRCSRRSGRHRPGPC
ncbi:hypothetical protein [Actinopolymorpha pittospori]|uniref:ABC-type multidrug transport system ATPase subunit n=1 Tax=Actinopolymorpha pittospori TaxID=648752 RepID=A0A927RBV1_9ACTN|nr:hypothetical protein [Actinopolymorpha pittospori]MBE1610547.1 ABC-type multidrug transport system ATPase subunit [Actinopolymorpha pittospori]